MTLETAIKQSMQLHLVFRHFFGFNLKICYRLGLSFQFHYNWFCSLLPFGWEIENKVLLFKNLTF